MTNSTPTGTCQICGQTVSLHRSTGEARKHNNEQGQQCKGWGNKPFEVTSEDAINHHLWLQREIVFNEEKIVDPERTEATKKYVKRLIPRLQAEIARMETMLKARGLGGRLKQYQPEAEVESRHIDTTKPRVITATIKRKPSLLQRLFGRR